MYNTGMRKSVSGFTIVELLIVVVVIAILAVITIVSYNGITKQADTSAAQSAAQQAAKKVALYAVSNGESFPATLSEVGIADTDTTRYQYRTYNNSKNYCITATSKATSYYIDNDTHGTPAAGACDGHGVNGGEVVTNLVTNPSITSTLGYSVNNQGSTAPVLSFSPSLAANKTHEQGIRLSVSSGGTLANAGVYTQAPGLDPSKAYTASVWVRSNKSVTYTLQIEQRNNAGTNTGTLVSSTVTLGDNMWKKLTLTAPPKEERVRFTFCVYGSGSVSVGDTIDFDDFMVTEGAAAYNFADGNSPGWIWNGTPNNSTSTGPAL